MTDLEKLCKEAHEARLKVGTLDTDIKNNVLKIGRASCRERV